MSQHRYVCIHGHFYQPPRENAWLEVIEQQTEAAPWHDWNERINHECYTPNTAARVLDEEEYIVDIVNNYSGISYNFGATLMSWLEKADPNTYKKVIAADAASAELFGGHGSAMAQIHSHLIMPLCNRQDKVTQVRWGISDFQYRFDRKPEGMWLAETAVDIETLEVLAEHDIRFTILAPRQAKAVKQIEERDWELLTDRGVDTKRPYRCFLPSGRYIDLFFYDGEIAKAVAFEGLLNNGKYFAERLVGAFDNRQGPQLVHIATDGESYGHHHRFGEMALASCLQEIKDTEDVHLTNYAEYLSLFPPTWEAQIHEDSSWSCVHGVERWRSNCGCNAGRHIGWTQTWRGPLREALDWLRDELIPLYEREAGKYLKDVWAARNDYIKVLLKRENWQVRDWLDEHAKVPVNKKDWIPILRLMEMQRHTLLMYTSCGWFFDEVSGLETNQILQYANRAVYYAQLITNNTEVHENFIQLLEKTPSNVYPNAAVSYAKNVIPAQVDLTRVGMHFAASTVFTEKKELHLFNYSASSEVLRRFSGGNQRLLLGRAVIKSRVTFHEQLVNFGVLYLGQQILIGSISLDMERETFDRMALDVSVAFQAPDLGQTLMYLNHYFNAQRFSLSHLFSDEKRRILGLITQKSLERAEQSFRDIYEDNYQLMSSMKQLEITVPTAYLSAVEFVLNRSLSAIFERSGPLHVEELERLSREFLIWNVQITDEEAVHLIAEQRLVYELEKMSRQQTTLRQINDLTKALMILDEMGITLDAGQAQNIYFSMLEGYRKDEWVFAGEEWRAAFFRLGDQLKVKVSI